MIGAAATTPFLPRSELAQAAHIAGAGATSCRAAYEKWAQLAQGPLGVQVKYEGSNSNTGADQVAARQIDFASMDNPKRAGLLREQLLIQFPTPLSAFVAVANLPGVQPNQLKLTGDLLADLFLGKITIGTTSASPPRTPACGCRTCRWCRFLAPTRPALPTTSPPISTACRKRGAKVPARPTCCN